MSQVLWTIYVLCILFIAFFPTETVHDTVWGKVALASSVIMAMITMAIVGWRYYIENKKEDEAKS